MASLISIYAPTLVTPEDSKDEFYNQLDHVISSIPHKHKLIIVDDFHARVGRDYQAYAW